MPYSTYYGAGVVSGSYEDAVIANACGTPSSAVPLYEYNPYLDSAQTTNFDYGQSQVDDTTFTNSTDLSASQVQTFLKKIKTGSLLARFYFNATQPANGGWSISTATGAVNNTYSGSGLPSATTFCEKDISGNRTLCPVSGDVGELAASYMVDAATTNTVNPKLILTTLQKDEFFGYQDSYPNRFCRSE